MFTGGKDSCTYNIGYKENIVWLIQIFKGRLRAQRRKRRSKYVPSSVPSYIFFIHFPTVPPSTESRNKPFAMFSVSVINYVVFDGGIPSFVKC